MSRTAWCLCLVLWWSASCAAQESNEDAVPQQGEQARSTGFELADDPALDKHIVTLLKNYVSAFSRPAELLTPSELGLIEHSIRKEITSLVATEGYFSPVLNFANRVGDSTQVVRISVKLGQPTRVASTQINFTGGAVPVELQQSISSEWLLPNGAVFRDAEWSHAKYKALDDLTQHSYAGAKITQSEALVQDEDANLTLELDSGPSFRIGALHIVGLRIYQPWLIERYNPPEPGTLYSRDALLKFQRELQNSPYFASVTVSTDPDPALADSVPVDVLVTERKKYDVGLGAGVSSNTGARGEVSFQDRNFWDDAYNLKSVIRIEQKRQIGYVDMFLPPRTNGYLDSVGGLFDRTDISGLVTSTSSLGVKRAITENAIERRFGLSFVYEESATNGGPQSLAKALVSSIGWTRRQVNNAFDPRSGYVAQLDISGAAKAVLSDQNFVRLYGKFQYWIPVAAMDVIILRAEVGDVFAPSSDGIPEEYLFRAGGSGSVRGYSYQSLGIAKDNAVVGGRVMATATAEYVHWMNDVWGVAGFVDVGDAADKFSTLHLARGTGAGVRFKTPAGPIAVDAAYGNEVQKWRLDFSIGIAF